jgi:hypothetical protein
MTAVDGAMALRRRTVLATALAALCVSCAATAFADPVDLTVVDRDTGQPLRVWRHDGRLFVAGRPGARYSLKVANNTDGRVLVVMSVDGVNILTGETANYDQRGYVFDAHESYAVNGWRKSDTEVAAFTFASLPQSYAARTGRPADVGVIGVAVFNEHFAVPAPVYTPPPPVKSESPSDSRRGASDHKVPVAVSVFTGASRDAPVPAPPPVMQPAPAAGAEALAAPDVVTAERREDKLGTAHGVREWSVSTEVPFERAADFPLFVSQIEYDSYDNLVASGVISRAWGVEHQPRPFPSHPDGEGFVPDPPSGG